MFVHFLRSHNNNNIAATARVRVGVRVLRRTLFFSNPAEGKPPKTSRIPWYVRGFRCLQVGLIAYGIHDMGVSRGLQLAKDHPREIDLAVLRSALPLSSATEEEIARFRAIKHSEEYQRVDRIMREMIPAAKAVIVQRLKELDQDSEADAELRNHLGLGLMKLDGPWELVLFPNKSFRAFVSPLCRKIFMFTGLLDQMNPTDDELAFIIGHELSHIILGHCERGGKTSMDLMTLQLMLLTLVDPTGLSAMVYDCLAYLFRKTIEATYSRSEEYEADRMALEIAANACFDIRKCAVAMHKFALIEPPSAVQPHTQTLLHAKRDAALAENNNKLKEDDSIIIMIAEFVFHLTQHLPLCLFMSHPPSAERFEALKLAAAEMIVHFQTDFAIKKRGWKVDPGDDSLKSLEHINRPNHCYGVWGDLERCGIPFTKWFVY